LPKPAIISIAHEAPEPRTLDVTTELEPGSGSSARQQADRGSPNVTSISEPQTEAQPPQEPQTEEPQTEEPQTEEPQTEEPQTEEPQTEEVSLAVWDESEPDDQLARRDTSTTSLDIERVPLPSVLDERLVMLRDSGSAQARSYRLLRHRLLAHPGMRVVAVTSARPGEGKTTCALNLALALGEDAMMSVLLLEANLRRPALREIFGFSPGESIGGNIARIRNIGPPYPVTAIGGTRLHVSALPEAFPEGRLDRTLFSVALFELKNAYDCIVVDAASVLESGDADVIGECADGVILTTRAGQSRRDDLRQAIRQLEPAVILGTVLLDA
jgi:Mrp family chromosome partitioning ATPase